MRYERKIIPDAYHGTCLYQCNSILQFGFQINRDPRLRLGDGVYFYENSFDDAIAWSENNKNCSDGPAVVRAVIIVNSDHILDLNNKEDQQLVSEIAEELQKVFKEENVEQTISDAVVINYIAQHYENIHMVRGTFTDIKKVQRLHPKSRFSNYSQLVICVRNTDIIKQTSQEYP